MCRHRYLPYSFPDKWCWTWELDIIVSFWIGTLTLPISVFLRVFFILKQALLSIPEMQR
jgi:hypothetical protein